MKSRTMELPKNELQVVPNMIMCGDHRSITKTELNAKEPEPKPKPKEEEKGEDVKKFTSYGTIAPSSSRTERTERTERTVSEHALRALQARRRAGPDAPANRALIHAAIGSFRWPPYLLCVWVLVLVLTHALHCLVAALDRALPPLRGACQGVRACAERRWRGESEGAWHAGPLALACAAGALYALHAALCALRAAALWALEPLGADADALVVEYEREEEAAIDRL